MSAELLIEVRCEELPPSMIAPAVEALRDGVKALLEGVPCGAATTYATPRRIAVVFADVAEARPSASKLVTGPPADRAFVDGKPTQAAIGFAKGKGVPVEAIQIVDTPKGKVIAVTVSEGGEKAKDLVEKGLDGVVRGLPFGKSMEWGNGGVRWGRPIQGVAAVLGGVTLAGTVAALPITNSTIAHRLKPEPFAFASASEWLAGLRARWVEPDVAARRAEIVRQFAAIAQGEGADPIVDEALLDQVVQLVEAPKSVVCTFEQDLLHLPPRLLVHSMKVHQRYFPIFKGGELTNRFVAVSNNPGGDDAIMGAGFARVLRSRFFDAKFFFAEDKKKRLEAHGERLAGMRWIKGLGSMAEKQDRVRRIAVDLVTRGLLPGDAAAADRAGTLAKCDLVTQMVGEFPELQGHMGRLYAKAQGESDAVSWAIEEHYLPRFAEDDVAKTPNGAVLAIADRLDTLVGCFGVGMAPKGNDPLGLRRAALGLVRTLIAHDSAADLRALFGHALVQFHGAVRSAPEGYQAWTKERGTAELPKDAEGLVEALVEFAMTRWKAGAVAEGATSDLADAVVYGGQARPLVAQQKLAALRTFAGTADFVPMMQTFKRVLNISKGAEGRPGPATEPAEQGLAAAIEAVEGKVAEAAAAMDYTTAFASVQTLKDPVARFFDEVLVDSPEPAVKGARIALLQRVGKTFHEVADFSRITPR